MYGASKLSAEALIFAYAEAFNLKTYIFRFVSILGPRYSHGHVYDFIKKLNQNPKKLNVLGDGNQKNHTFMFQIVSLGYLNQLIHLKRE